MISVGSKTGFGKGWNGKPHYADKALDFGWHGFGVKKTARHKMRRAMSKARRVNDKNICREELSGEV